jgi:lipid II:glycine glycyltransferase (peptidoglycan interpeptide bridge formation enzyme)
LLLTDPADLRGYEEYLQNASGRSLWQSLEWRGYQESLGRGTRVYGRKNDKGEFSAIALVVIDRTAFGLSTWDIPRGPLSGDPREAAVLLEEIIGDAQEDHALSLYVSPPGALSAFSYQLSARAEQPEATLVLDLTLSEDALLAQMKPKGRYNIGVAKRHGVRVEESHDIAAFYRLLRETARHDGFTALPKLHYECFLRELPRSFLLLAYPPAPQPSPRLRLAGSSPIAALLGVIWEATGIYYYGASDYRARALMAPYLLQWEAIKRCKAAGCTAYDLLGIAPGGYELQAVSFEHPLTGVTAFKRQFGGREVCYPPEREIVLRPVLKRLLHWKRKFC